MTRTTRMYSGCLRLPCRDESDSGTFSLVSFHHHGMRLRRAEPCRRKSLKVAEQTDGCPAQASGTLCFIFTVLFTTRFSRIGFVKALSQACRSRHELDNRPGGRRQWRFSTESAGMTSLHPRSLIFTYNLPCTYNVANSP